MNPLKHSSSPISHGDALFIALFIATIIHAIVLMNLNFSISKPEKIHKSLNITIASTPAKKAPEKARFLAQENQVGAAKKTNKPQAKKRILAQNGEAFKHKPAPEKQSPQTSSAQKIITRQPAPEKKLSSEQIRQSPAPKPRLNKETLKMQIAQLGERVRHRQLSAEHTKIKFVNQISAHKYIASQYIKDWENKVERTGNMNYPEIARKKGFHGILTMDVGIKEDGSIYDIRIAKSSGIKTLDQAAIKIVRQSAPFAALPAELAEQVDVLVITRVWKFSDESMTTR